MSIYAGLNNEEICFVFHRLNEMLDYCNKLLIAATPLGGIEFKNSDYYKRLKSSVEKLKPTVELIEEVLPELSEKEVA